MRLATLFTLIMLCTGLAGPRTAGAEGRLVLAFYYGWFGADSWNDARLIDRPAEPYGSGDRGAMARQISQAKSAGIDGFVMSWYGPGEGVTNGNLWGLLDQAAAQGFKVAADVDLGAGWMNTPAAAAEALRYLVNDAAGHAAYLRFDGKPVVFFWNQRRFSVAQWQDIRAQTDPNHNTIWIAEGAAASYLGAFDGLHNYNVAWSADPAGTNATWARRARAAGGYFVATAMPGFDDTRLGRGDAATLRPRADGAYFRQSFNGAAATNPHMIVITSWNEFLENSYIEPSQNYGTFYLDLARELIAAYKAGGTAPAAPSVASQPAAPAPPPETADGLVAIPTVSRLNVRQEPTTASAILGQAGFGQRYPILGRSEDGAWWRIRCTEGSEGWIYAAYARYEGGSLQDTAAASGSAETTPSAPAASGTPSGDIVAIPLNDIPIREQATNASARLATASAGERFPIVGKTQDGQWWLVAFDGGRGWMYARYARYEFRRGQDLDTIPVTGEAGAAAPAASGAPQAAPASSALNIFAIPTVTVQVRTAPTVTASTLTELPPGGKYPIVGKSLDGAWWQIEYAAGSLGWMYAPAARYEYYGGTGLDQVPVVE